MDKRLTLTEQAIIASQQVDSMFVGTIPPIPEDATIESLWKELCRANRKSKKPKKVDAVKILLEDSRLTGLSIPLLADIIKKVFNRNGVTCDTSESSIRWYISQKTLEWDIKPRDKKIIDIETDNI